MNNQSKVFAMLKAAKSIKINMGDGVLPYKIYLDIHDGAALWFDLYWVDDEDEEHGVDFLFNDEAETFTIKGNNIRIQNNLYGLKTIICLDEKQTLEDEVKRLEKDKKDIDTQIKKLYSQWEVVFTKQFKIRAQLERIQKRS